MAENSFLCISLNESNLFWIVVGTVRTLDWIIAQLVTLQSSAIQKIYGYKKYFANSG